MVVVADSHNMLSALTTSSGVLTNNTPGVGGRAGNVNMRGGGRVLSALPRISSAVTISQVFLCLPAPQSTGPGQGLTKWLFKLLISLFCSLSVPSQCYAVASVGRPSELPVRSPDWRCQVLTPDSSNTQLQISEQTSSTFLSFYTHSGKISSEGPTGQ